MVFRKAYDTINRVGRAWENATQGTYNTPARPDRHDDPVARLLARVVADWPESVTDTPAVTAAREYLARTNQRS